MQLHPGQAWNPLIDEYLADFFRRHPLEATFSGRHDYDGDLEDFAAAALADEARVAADFERRLAAVPRDGLGASELVDLDMLGDHCRLRRLEIEEIATWRHSPMLYTDVLSMGLVAALIFPWTTLSARLDAVRRKAERVPALMASALANLERIPAAYRRVAAESFAGAAGLLRRDLTQAAAELPASERAAVVLALAAAADAIDATWRQLEPRFDDAVPYQLGAGLYARKLRYQEGVDIPLARILEVGHAELARAQAEVRRLAAEIDPAATFEQVWANVLADHPSAAELAPTAQRQCHETVAWLQTHDIVSLPTTQPVVVAPTPEFFRWSFASMWCPGPLETAEMPAYYFITEPDPAWSAEQVDEHLTNFNHSDLWATTVHEAYPGHYVQLAWLKNVASPVRRFWPFAPLTFVEGWAHYTEEMMAEAGFRDDTPHYRIGVLSGALVRLCRLVNAIEVHCNGWTLEQGTRFFVENAYMKELPAEREAERASFDPLYLVYTLGKLMIRKLREDYRETQTARGEVFSLRDFHDRLLGNGAAPITAHRTLLLPGDTRPPL